LLAQQFQRFVSLQDELEMEKERVADQAEQLQKHKRERELLLKKCASLSLDMLGALNEVTKVRKERDDALHALQVHTPRLTHV
jgi:phosphoribosyl-dephospho-CoA transferase